MKVLGKLAYDPYELSLPRLKAGRMFLDEVQQIVMRFGRESIGFGEQRGLGRGGRRSQADQFVLRVDRHRSAHAFGLRIPFTL